MVDIETHGGVFRFSHQDDPARVRDRIPMYVCRDTGLVTNQPGEGRQEIGELQGYAADGEVVVRVYGSAVSDELRRELSGPHLVFRDV